jgi:hypothetical protein
MEMRCLIIILIITLPSCITYQKCVDRYGVATHDTVEVFRELVVPVEVPLPNDTITVQVDCDSLVNQTKESQNLQSDITVIGNTVRVVTFIKKDSIRDTLKLVDTLYVPTPSVELVKPVRWYNRLWNGYKGFSAWAFLFCLTLIVVLIKK